MATKVVHAPQSEDTGASSGQTARQAAMASDVIGAAKKKKKDPETEAADTTRQKAFKNKTTTSQVVTPRPTGQAVA